MRAGMAAAPDCAASAIERRRLAPAGSGRRFHLVESAIRTLSIGARHGAPRDLMGKTLVKGLHLLERLAASPEPMGITELAADLDLVQSNVHRLLQTLMESGYVQQDALTRRYRCTMRLW